MSKFKLWILRILRLPYEYVTTYQNENGEKVLTLVVLTGKKAFATNFIVDKVVDAEYKQTADSIDIEKLLFVENKKKK